MADYHGTSGDDILDQKKLGLPDWSNIFGGGGSDTITLATGSAIGGPGNDTIIGTTPYSIAAYTDSPGPVTADLKTRQAQDGYGNVDTLVNIHYINAFTSSNTLLGSDTSDTFGLTGGNNYIDGRAGVDTAIFFISQSAYLRLKITYDTASATTTVVDPAGGITTLKSVERLTFYRAAGDGSDVSVLTSSFIPNYSVSLSQSKSTIVSVAGLWTPNGATDPVSQKAINFITHTYSQILLPNGRNGLVVNGWSYNGFDSTTYYPVSAAIFEQNQDGTLTNATSKYFPDALTSGSQSVIVADFNNDGKSDIFFAAHNESPFVPKPSTAYMSNSKGTFDKVTLNDSVEAHSAFLASYNGIPTVFTGTYTINGGDLQPYYQYINGAFAQTKATVNVTGNTSAVADFNGDGQADIAFGDNNSGPDYAWTPNNATRIAIYKLADIYNNNARTGAAEATLTPYFDNKPQYANVPSINGNGKTHVYALWTDDFNHDGKIDILAGGQLWTPSDNTQKHSMLQLFQNSSQNGVMTFVDKTDTLNSDYNVNSLAVDYSMQMLDIDHSGIKTYFCAGEQFPFYPNGGSFPDNTAQTNYILLNDGTGRLHIYMHDQFEILGAQINDYLGIQNNPQPRFIEYLTSDGKINLVATVGFVQNVNGNKVTQQKFINVPLQLNPTVDYTDTITIADRNQSMIMRTWAGNDVIYDTNANTGLTTINGGIGVDTSSYSKSYSSYKITLNSDGRANVTGNGLADTLTNVERLTFADKKIAIDFGVDASARETALLIGAAFGKEFLSNKLYVGEGLKLFDTGSSMSAIAQLLVSAKLVPSDNVAFVKAVWQNVIGSPIGTGNLSDFAGLLQGSGGNMAQADLLVLAATSQANIDHVGLVGLQSTGIEYVM
jgi:hypothetical protein